MEHVTMKGDKLTPPLNMDSTRQETEVDDDTTIGEDKQEKKFDLDKTEGLLQTNNTLSSDEQVDPTVQNTDSAENMAIDGENNTESKKDIDQHNGITSKEDLETQLDVNIVDEEELYSSMDVVSPNGLNVDQDTDSEEKDTAMPDYYLNNEDDKSLLNLIEKIEDMDHEDDSHLGTGEHQGFRHMKPKKNYISRVEKQDYECHEEDDAIIESVNGSQDEHIVVRIEDAFVTYYNFKCLLNPTRYLNGDVINAYIKLITAESHLLCREESTIHLENTFIVGLLHRDGKNKNKSKPNFKEDNIIERVTTYTAHDMVFLPINITNVHWYLAVINGKKREIQVLDSMGIMGRTDLMYALDGLQIQIDMALRAVDLKDTSKWPDLQVSSWPIVEQQFSHEMQTDCVSCGLFMLNFMEYWTGERLSDDFNQGDMTKFRLKLAAILLDTPLNTAREYTEDIITDDETSDPVEVFSVQQTLEKTPNDARKYTEDNVKDDETSDPVKVFNVQKTQMSQLRRTMYKDTATALCDYILTITDVDALGKEWVRSTHPHPISITLEKIQGILDVNKALDTHVFNLAVRMLACDETAVLREPKCHFMDLKFFFDCNYRRHLKHRKRHAPKDLAKYFGDWPNSGVSFDECELVMVPWQELGSYGVFALDKKHRIVAIIDPSPVTQSVAYNDPSNYYIPRLQKLAYTFDRAMDEVDPSWNDDIFDWKRVFPNLVPKIYDWCLTGFIIIELMNMWDGQDISSLLRVDSRIMRKWLMIEVLKCNINESEHNIPEEIRAAVNSIKNTYVEKFL
ncbi:unnamed protein product [Urochloa humidicola]